MSVFRGRRRDFFDDPTSDLGPSNPARVGILIAIIIGIFIIVTAAVFIAIKWVKARRRQQAKKQDAYLSKKEYVRRRKMSAAERSQEEEMERAMIIRKSLQSRVSMPISEVESEEDIELGLGSRRSSGLKDDWKEWEARLTSDTSLSRERHPSIAAPAAAVLAPARDDALSPQESGSVQGARTVRIYNVGQDLAGAAQVDITSVGPAHAE